MQVCLRYLLVFVSLFASPAFALDKVTLQLKWTHAFQFAGYYAAKEQGYYREAGLDVNILEAAPATDPVRNVLEGKAQYGIGTSNLLLERASGKPLVVLAVVFQQSPYEIYAGPNIHKLSDLIGKHLMLEPQSQELLAYLKKEGIPIDRIKLIPHSFKADSLMTGKTDAMSGYSSNEPFYFNQANYSYRTFSPRSAGIDFYGDNLFTSEKELREHPQQVKAFRAASMRGWQYAKDHKDEVISLIQSKYTPHYSVEYLHFESNQMIPLLQPDLIEIGYMNPERWQHIANTYADIGLIPKNFSLKGFIYNAIEPDLTWFYRGLLLALAISAVISVITLYVLRINRKMRGSLNEEALTQQALRKSEQHYRVLVENMRDVVWILDPVALHYSYVSPSVERFRGFTATEIMTLPINQTMPVEALEELRQDIHEHMAEFLSGLYPDKIYVKDLPLLCKDGSVVWGEAIAKCVRNEETGQIELHGVTRDISERKSAQEEIHYMAMHDQLTGLPNRTLLNDRLQQALATSKRENSRGALMFLDLDKFKQINDTLGHEVGDKMLKQVAARILDCMRESDTVARIGGDEFIVLLRTVEEVQDALTVAQKICSVLRQPFNVEEHDLQVSCSVGVALYPEHGSNGVELSKNADIAMYQAKEQGRDGVQLFIPDGKSQDELNI